ncbi:MAG: PSD1 and planctomycete cytochrome C domain-containing protein [Isosphaeraceae bacterium]|nr:PSD1 and planctomycete cytochrome C domain-containing protein [Isosphaeraceae bacterium]
MTRVGSYRRTVILCASALAISGGAPADDSNSRIIAPTRADLDFFESKIRPILEDRCIECHNGDKKKGGLRLDVASAFRAGGDSGPIVVPGNPGSSRLIEVVGYDSDLQMPPKAKLPEAEIAALTQWVARGAPWPAPDSQPTPASESASTARRDDRGRDHWAFRPISDPIPPRTTRAGWARDPIDLFIQTKLEAAGLSAAAEAERGVWLRRVTFDLIGLPPTPKELADFLADASPVAHETVVDRLLASPHFGERWARHWLDLARYGEDQAHSFQPRLYPQGFRYRDWVIDAFNRDLPYDRFLLEQIAGDLLPEPNVNDRLPALGFFALGPVYYGDPKRHDQVDDRIDTLTRGVLGLTVACARCHDHKFDPIPTADYYALAGVFHSSEYREAPLAPPDVVVAHDRAAAEAAAAAKRVDEFLQANARAVLQRRLRETPRYVRAAWLRVVRRASSGAKPLENGSIDGLDDSLIGRWVDLLAASTKGQPRSGFEHWARLTSKAAESGLDESKHLEEVDRFGRELTRRLVDLEVRISLGSALGSIPRADLIVGAGASISGLDRFRSLDPISADDRRLYDAVLGSDGFLRVPKNKQKSVLDDAGRSRLASLEADAKRAKEAIPPKYPIAHALTEAADPVEMRILIRGNAANPGPKVSRRFLSVLGGEGRPFGGGSGRLDLARAIASPTNPLTARVFVNRVWQHLVGTGLVATTSNFGSLGEPPSHPELLDHLASRFLASGWSTKRLVKAIVLSSTYRQSTQGDPRGRELDPENRLVGRMSRKRLEVEPWRDAVLAASGRLDRRFGGPSITLETPDNHRRTLYAKISRHDLSPILRLFDFPDPNITSGERTRTTVALQQLIVLNDEWIIRSARDLATRVRRASADDRSRIERAYRILFTREPTSREVDLALAYLAKPDPPSSPAAPNPLSRWDRLAQALIASNEFMFID